MAHYSVQCVICVVCWLCVYVAAAHRTQVTIPHRVTSTGEFISHYLPTYWHRASTVDDLVHYVVHLDGEPHHLELRPNRALLAPLATVETHGHSGIRTRRARNVQCHFTGQVRGVKSRVALATCGGLAGHISTPRGQFTIEPQEALTDDRHPHLVHLRHRDAKTSDDQAKLCPDRGPVRNKRDNRPEIKVVSDVSNMYTTDVKNDLYLELLIVLDKTFVDHHTERDSEEYVMTIMNMAHDLFVQESLGRPVYLSIVRIIRLEVEDNEINVAVIQNPSKALESFQKWQAMVNPGNDSHPNHHDLAVLITRINIYANNNNRDLLGVSRQTGTCSRRQSGVIAQDLGLALGYVVAHEIGHSLGFLHDDPGVNGCNTTLDNGLGSVMSPRISISTGDWSGCSKKYLRIFIESGYGHCLLDHPGDHPFTFTDELPGVIYDGNWQCRSMFGGEAEMCASAPRCDTLLCEVPNEGCMDMHTPPADGTSCGDDKWCYHGQCLERGMRPGSRDGGWGPWGSWSKCSRTCGTGVAYRERRCDSPQPNSGGEFCKGPKRKYKICNAVPCPSTSSFRDLQCTKFNSWTYDDGKTHSWKAVLAYVDDPCTLYCINELDVVAKLAERVIDGTSCMRGMHDICIAGTCVRIPCDLQMDSGAIEDVCGICHGDGTTCALKEGIKDFKDPSATNNISHTERIYKLIDLPEGSQNIHVEETEPTKSRIEVRDIDGNQVYVAGQAYGVYEVPGSRAWIGMLRANQETLHIPGPIMEPLSIWVDPKSNVSFKYSLAVETEKRQGAFAWDYVDWTPCTTQCGVGTTLSKVRCIEQSSGLVEDSYCSGPKLKDVVKSCENKPCASRWFVGDWEKCVKKRGALSTRRRYVRCIRPIGGELSDIIVIQDSNCPQPKPIDRENCTCGENARRKRKVFHMPNMRTNTKRLHTWSSKSRKVRRTEEEEESIKVNNEDVNQFALKKGKVNLDRLNRDGLKLRIKSQEQKTNDSSPRTIIRELYGNEVEAELDRLYKCRPKQDQI